MRCKSSRAVASGKPAALRWQSYDATIEALGGLPLRRPGSTRKSREKATKTEQPRSVSVHPLLASILAEWKLSGWSLMMGRAPTPNDLLIPTRLGRHRGCNHSLVRFHEDLARLGLRLRRQHDLRRTFISLARTDGTRKDVLERVTHGASSDIVDLYTELPWSPLCEEVAKLKLTLRTPKLLNPPSVLGAKE